MIRKHSFWDRQVAFSRKSTLGKSTILWRYRRWSTVSRLFFNFEVKRRYSRAHCFLTYVGDIDKVNHTPRKRNDSVERSGVRENEEGPIVKLYGFGVEGREFCGQLGWRLQMNIAFLKLIFVLFM